MKKFEPTKKSIFSLVNIAIILLALIVLLSPCTRLHFLADGFSYVFGFVGFWGILPFIISVCVYSLIKNKFPKIKINHIFWGILIMIISLFIIFSVKKDLRFNNIIDNYHNVVNESKGLFPKFALGGGIAGYFIAGSLNSLITPIGTYILVSVLMLAGLIFVFYKQLGNLFSKIKKSVSEEKEIARIEKEKKIADQKAQEELEKELTSNSESVQKEEPTFINTPVEQDKSYYPKAHLVLEEEKQTFVSPEPVFNEPNPEIIKQPEPVVEPIQPTVTNVVQESPIPSVQNNTVNIVTQPVQPEAPKPVKEEDPQHRQQPALNLIKDYVLPPTNLLKIHSHEDDSIVNEASVEERTNIINQTLANFRIGAQVVGHTVGPSVTRFDVQMNEGYSVNLIDKYIKDISVKLNGLRVRFESIVSGKSTSGLEVPNEKRTNVGLREAIESLSNEPKHLMDIPFGKNISNEWVTANLADFPHMLVSGTTGSGKTIFIHSIILSLIMRNTPDQLRLILIDPKKVEMTYYKEIPHLLCPNISDPKQAHVALKHLVDEMERRYNLFAENCVRDIKGFNAFALSHNLQPLPYIVVFIDEFADLVEQVKEIKEPVVRIAAKSRAAGIHIVLATQRPSVNVIDGLIKGNIPTRVALLSASATDSITIIDEGGAEKLLGHGDMLVKTAVLSTTGKPRVQGCFMEEEEITSVCDFLRSHYKVNYDPYFLDLRDRDEVNTSSTNTDAAIEAIGKAQNEETQYQQIKEVICTRQYCSISYIQRTFGMGFPRAGKIFNRLVQEGIVASEGDARGSKVLVSNPVINEQQMGTVEQSTFIPDDNKEIY